MSFADVRADGASLGTIHGLTPASGGMLIASHSGLFRATGTALDRVPGGPEQRVFFAAPEPDGGMLVGLSGVVRQIGRSGTRALSLAAYGDGVIPKLHLRGCGGAWIATTAGLLRLTEGRYVRYNKLDGLRFAATWAIHESRRGGLWVGGQGGVARFTNGRFEELASAAREPAERVVTTLLEDSAGRLWTATRTGLTWTDLASSRTARVLEAMVLALAEAPDDTIWIGGLSGLHSFRAGRLERHGEPEGIARVRGLLVSARHGLVVGTEQGVFVTSSGARAFERFDGPVFAEGRRVGALFEEDNGDVWVGYLGDGLARYVAARSAWTLYTERDGLLSNTVYGVRVGRDGRIWIATQKGVLRVDRVAFDRVDRQTANAPTADAAARARPPASADEDATPALDPDIVVSITGREPGASAGYCCNGGSGSSVLLASDGSLWLPTLDGVLHIDTNQALATRSAPPTILVSMRHGTRTRAFGPSQRVDVPANERDLEFIFTAPTFDQPGLTRFRYRLDGYDEEWKEVRGRRSVSYTNLPAGDYTFRVSTGAGEADAAGGEASWPFAILPRVTETWWFYALLAPVILGAVYGVVAVRLRRLEQQRARLERLVAERTTQLKDANEELGRMNVRLQEQSHTDPLTQLWNRRYLSDRIERDLAQVARLREKKGSEDLSVVFVLIDLDHFKPINDVHGHEVGDEVLAETARRLKGVARDTDYVVRWGGEEFLLVVCFSPADKAPRIAERVMGALWSKPFAVTDNSPLALTGSVGFSLFPFGAAGAPAARHDPRDWQSV